MSTRATDLVRIHEFRTVNDFWNAEPVLKKDDIIEMRLTDDYLTPAAPNDEVVRWRFIQINRRSQSNVVCVGLLEGAKKISDVFQDPRKRFRNDGQLIDDWLHGKPYNIVVWRSSDKIDSEKTNEDADDSKVQQTEADKRIKYFADMVGATQVL